MLITMGCDVQYRLKRDLVIPAGTLFGPAPTATRRYAPYIGHYLPLGQDGVFEVVTPLDLDNPDFADFFEEE